MAEVVCQLCHIRVEKSALEGHISTEHLKVKVEKFPFRCPSCDFRGPTRDWVEKHQKERGHKGEVKDESGSISYLTILAKLISTSCEAAHNVGMSAVLDIFDNNLGSGGSFRDFQPQLSNAEKFAVPTRIKAEPNPKGIQIHKGTVDDPVVIDSDSDVTDVHPAENVFKVPQRKEIRKTPMIPKSTSKIHSAKQNFTVPAGSKGESNPKGIQIRWGTSANPVSIDSDSDVELEIPENVTKVPQRKEIQKVPVWVRGANPIGKITKEIPSKTAASGAKLPKIRPTANRSAIAQANQQSIATQKIPNRVGIVVGKRLNLGRFKCHRCGKTYSSLAGLKGHSYTHGRTKFPCDHCEKIYSQPNSLRDHKRLAHSNERSRYRCAHCGKGFLSKSLLRDHIYTHLSTKVSCDKCDKKLANWTKLRRHLKVVHPTKTQFKWKCPHCPRKFVLVWNFRSHLYVHSNVFHSCADCDFKSKYTRQLSRHRRQKHSAVPFTKYQCDECQQPFFTRVALSQHRYAHHSQKPKFPCGYCGLICAYPSQLRNHIEAKHTEAESD